MPQVKNIKSSTTTPQISHPSLTFTNASNEQTLTVKQGKRVALLGLNGAGKSTFIRQLIGEKNNPEIEVLYHSNKTNETNLNTYITPESLEFKKMMGYQADTMLSMEKASVSQYLNICAGLKGIKKDQARKSIEQISNDWRLNAILNKQLESLSKGNMQKAAIAQAFINNPCFLFFDEPCQSLDPLEQESFLHNIASLNQFSICIFSTHNINHALSVADDIIIIHQSKIAYFYEEKKEKDFLMFSFEPTEKIKHALDQEAFEYQDLQNGLFKLMALNSNKNDSIESFVDKKKIPFEFCLTEKEALMPLFRLLASNEWTLA